MDWISLSELSALAQVIVVDLVLAGDNAVVIGMAVAGLPREQRAETVRLLGRRWKPVGWASLAVLGVSGVWLAFGYWGADDPDVLFGSETGHLLIAKAVLYVSLVTTAALHDFVLGPRLNRQIREGRPRTLLRPMQIVGWLSFAATLLLPILGVLITT